MKVNTIDYIWAAVSVMILGMMYYKGLLEWGILIVYALMAIIYVFHINKVKKRISGSVAVYGMVTGYHTANGGRLFYPVVKYETESGREINSVYQNADTEERYETGDEVMICYDPEDPVFFYFSDREDDLTRDYYRYMLYGGIIAVVLFMLTGYIF